MCVWGRACSYHCEEPAGGEKRERQRDTGGHTTHFTLTHTYAWVGRPPPRSLTPSAPQAAPAASAYPSAPTAAAAATAVAAPSAGFSDVAHTQIKRITAARLQESKKTIPHYYLTLECTVWEGLGVGGWGLGVGGWGLGVGG